jgi:ketosteroid isomerase-like protein
MEVAKRPTVTEEVLMRSHLGRAHLAAFLLAAPAATAGAQDRTADSAAAALAVHGYHQALEAGDSTAALALLADDAVILEAGGVETRAEYRANHLPADIAFARAVPAVRSPLAVSVQGDVAWVSSSSASDGTYEGRDIRSQGAELMVLTRDGTSWRIRAIHWSSRRRPTGGP